MKKICFIVLAILMALTGTMPAFATSVEVSSVEKLDVNNQIRGDVVEYTLDIPASWKKYVYAEREAGKTGANEVEKVSIYYKPVSVSSSPALLYEIVVFKKDNWGKNAEYTKISESEKYVFAYKIPSTNPFVFGSDRLIFENLLKEASKSNFIKDYMSFPSDRDDFVKHTVSVNGKRMPSRAYANALKVVYVPIREVCQELGYSVGWNEDDATVTISSGSFYTALGRNIKVKQKYNIVTFDGKSYVSTMFMLEVLKCGVEIDQYNNVRITKELQ